MLIGINGSFLRRPGTGIGQVSAEFLRALRDWEGEERFILYLDEEIDWELTPAVEAKVIAPLWRRDDLLRLLLWERVQLPRAVRADGCEAFFSLYQSTTVLPAAVRHLMLVHDLIPEIFPAYLDNWRKKLIWRLSKKAIRQASVLSSVSRSTAADLEKILKIAAAKIHLTPPSVEEIFSPSAAAADKARVAEKYSLPPGGYIYFGGGLDLRKNAPALLEAYRRLRAARASFPPLVVSGKLQPALAPLWTDIESLVREMGLSESVRILGFVPREDLPALYGNALFFVYPSLYEGFGLPVLEALAVGAPVACSNTPAVAEVAGEAALFFDPNKVE
ncbi:MAG TPA: glycosyltransferase family 1 protein, partial [Candidatus Moranbacteria bacterium]|nr:glycosyltransferase family 1 protein [Candidatus Moranbacteria bacterium]